MSNETTTTKTDEPEFLEYDHNGTTVRLPVIKKVKTGQIRKYRHLDEGERGMRVIWDALEETLTDEELDYIDGLDPEEFGELLDRHNKATDLEKK